MPRDDSFKDFVLDQLADLPDASARSMFGGHGLYLGGDFFGIVYDHRVYFRTDDETRGRYEDAGSGPFQPNARQTLKSYYEVPPEVVEDRERLVEWAADAVASRAPKAD